MPVKRCAVCKKPAYTTTTGSQKDGKWLCSACRLRFEANEFTNKDRQGGRICEKCKKKNDVCRFSASERQKITACSDWEGRNTAHDKKRWAKFEKQD
ncbi:MAG: hypothetical protein ACYC21_13510 [Eubacteriales bacterium]|nr:hypothetical protein [Bacillota bacterium]